MSSIPPPPDETTSPEAPAAEPPNAPALSAGFRRESWRERLTPDWRSPRVRVVGAVLLVMLIVAGVLWQRCGFSGCPDVHSLSAYQPGGAPVLLDKDGKRFGDLAPVEGELVRLLTLPKYVPDAFVAVEDRRFREHGALDWPRVFGAVMANLRAGGVDEGFSTITMQLARNVFPEELPGQQRTYRRKLLEIRVAREIEGEFTKDEILELYLNHIYFGNGARGIEAASRHYFGKPASKLTLPEAALLAGMPKAPSHYDPRRHPEKAKERRNLVLSLMAEQGVLDAAAGTAAQEAPVKVAPRGRARSQDGTAAYFVEEVRRELEEVIGPDLYRQPINVFTTLDVGLQRAAEQALERQLLAVESGTLGPFTGPRFAPGTGDEEGSPYLQGAFVALDVKTGGVLAWVGGRDFQQSRFDRVRSASRQTGSTFKPFVFAAALSKGRPLTERVSDEPISIPLDRKRNWVPKNFDGHYGTAVTLREALVHSKNVATIRVAQQVGSAEIVNVATTFGVPGPIPEQPSMPLGTVSASPLDMATAFSAFASLGHRVTPRTIVKVEGPNGELIYSAREERTKVVDASIAYLITDVLQEAVNRGTGTAVRAAGYRGTVAGKTGTTNDGADAWFVGYTPDVVSAVWVGFDQPRQIVPRATGGRVAAPVWARAMSQFYGSGKAPAFANPGGVTAAYVDTATGFVLDAGCVGSAPAYKELFLSGHVPQAVCPTSGDPTLYAGGLPPGVTVGPDGLLVGPDGLPYDPEDTLDPEFATGDAAWPQASPAAGSQEGMMSYTPSAPTGPSPATRPGGQGDSRFTATGRSGVVLTSPTPPAPAPARATPAPTPLPTAVPAEPLGSLPPASGEEPSPPPPAEDDDEEPPVR